MPIPRLRRVDITLYRRALFNSSPVPLALALVDFYRQGATVSTESITIANGSTALVEVFDKGKLENGSTVMGSGIGPELTVSSVASPTEVLLHNTSGSAVTLRRGVRLVLLSNPPELYSDPFGTNPLGSSLTTDVNGSLQAYIDEDWFDYVANGEPVTVDSTSSQSSSGTFATLSWSHTVSGNDGNRVLLVGLSWTSGTGGDNVSGITYGGVALTQLGSLNYGSIWYLLNPPTGENDIVITWSGSDEKAAICGAVSFNGVNQVTPFGPLFTAQNTSTTPSVLVTGTDKLSAVFDTLAVALGLTGTSATVGAGQTQEWNSSAGSSANLDRTLGAGSIEPGSGSSVTMSWTLGTSKPWEILAVQVKPSALVAIDVPGAELEQSAFGLNVHDFQSIQDAIDAALPGQTVFIPAGTYLVGPPEGSPEQTAALIVKRAITLRGEGPMATIIKARDPNPWYDILDVTGTQFHLSGVTLHGNAGDDTYDVSCLKIHAIDIDYLIIGCNLESVVCTNAGGTGIVLSDLLSTVAVNVESVWNHKHGIRLEVPPFRSPDRRVGGNTVRLVSCSFNNNDGKGVEMFGLISVQLVACAIAHNRGGLEEGEGQAIDIDLCNDVLLSGCYFEGVADASPSPPIAQQYIRAFNSICVVVDSSHFSAAFGTPLKCALFHTSRGARFTSNFIWDFTGDTLDPIARFMLSPDGVEYGNVRIGPGGATDVRFSLDEQSRPSLTRDVWINAGDFESIQAAINAVPPQGAVVFIPAGSYVLPATLELPLDRSVHLMGAGAGATVLFLDESSTSPAADAVVRLRGDYQTISDLTIVSAGLDVKALVIGRYEGERTYTPVVFPCIRDCEFLGTGRWAIYGLGEEEGDPPHIGVAERIRGAFSVTFTEEEEGGAIRMGPGCKDWVFTSVRIEVPAADNRFFLMEGAENVRWEGCSFVSPENVSSSGIGIVRDASGVQFARCDFRFEDENMTSGPQLLLEGENRNVTLDSCRFKRVGALSGTVEIEVAAGGQVRGFVIVNPLFEKPSSSTNEIVLRAGVDLELTGGAVILTDLSPPGLVPVRIDDAAIGSGNSLRYAGILGVGSRLRLPAYVATQINSTTSRIPGEATWSST